MSDLLDEVVHLEAKLDKRDDDIAGMKDELDRLRAEVAEERAKHALTIQASNEQSEQLSNLRAEVERLREALREVNENLPGSCTDEKSWLAECLREVREIISDALASTAPKTEDADSSDPEYDQFWAKLPDKKCPTCHTSDPYGHEPGCVWLHETPWMENS